MGSQNLIVNPDTICFQEPYEEPQQATLKMTNCTECLIAYRIMATQPDWLQVKPRSGFVQPMSITTPLLQLEPIPNPEEVSKKQHKVVVESAINLTNMGDIDQFWKEVDQQANRVQFQRVKLVRLYLFV